jgi:murein L,D-transpeptidase YcbB/YkuD
VACALLTASVVAQPPSIVTPTTIGNKPLIKLCILLSSKAPREKHLCRQKVALRVSRIALLHVFSLILNGDIMLPLTAVACVLKGKRGCTVGLLRALTLLSVSACADSSTTLDRTVGIALERPVKVQSANIFPNIRPSLSTQSALYGILLSRKSAAADADQLLAFYESRKFQPAWTGGSLEEEMARQLRFVLARAHEQGLNDDNYHVPEKARPAFGSEAAEYDLALTKAVLLYSRDVRTGRVRPTDIYDDVGLPPPSFDAPASLAQAVTSYSLTSFLADLPPRHLEYRRLAQALARYRSIADDGDWPSILDKTEIKIESRDSRLKLLAKRLAFEDMTLAAIVEPSGAELREAVKRFQARYGLNADGQVGSETLAVLNVSASNRAAQIAANMERWRWMPRTLEHRYIAVNIPDQSLEFVRDGTIVLTSKVVVGRKASPTPIARSIIVAVVANPPWNIPGYIAARDLLPHLRQDANYLAPRHMVVMDGPPGDPTGHTIDWRNIKPAEFPYAIRQLPGPNTALGALMLDSPNDFDVYLHDTPSKKLFDSNQREISNGCVRVQHIFPLASLALTDDQDEGMDQLADATKSHETQRLPLENPLPVYFLYWTALVNADGEVGFRPDRYGRDAPLTAALTQANGSSATYEHPSSARPGRDAGPQEEGADLSP